MKSIKILALFLALLMVLPLLFAGCAKDDGKKDDAKADVIEEDQVDPNEVYDAEVRDLGGHEFWFLSRDAGKYSHLQTNEIFAEELNGDKINDAVFKRNSVLQEKYNCVINEERVEDPTKSVKEQLLAGEYQYDFIYSGMTKLRTLSASNLLVDFKELENVSLNKTWWDQNAVEGFSIGGKVFYVTGAGSTLDERAAWVMVFNRDFVETARLESPYTLVKEGKWTVDKMVEYMTATAQDLDGDGVYTIGKDRFGYIGEPINNWFHVAACNVRLSRVSSSGEIEIPPTPSDELLNVWAALKPLLTSPLRNVTDSSAEFRSGRGAFFACNCGAILLMERAQALNFGIIPMPKLNEEQEEYYTSSNGFWTYGYAIPVATDNATDAEANGFDSGREQAGYFLEAFFYYSSSTLDVAFYEQVVKHQVIQDEDSIEMLDLALKNKLFDPVVIFDFGKIGSTLFKEVGSVGGMTAGSGTPAVGSDANYDTLVSTYASRLEAARKSLIKYIENISADD